MSSNICIPMSWPELLCPSPGHPVLWNSEPWLPHLHFFFSFHLYLFLPLKPSWQQEFLYHQMMLPWCLTSKAYYSNSSFKLWLNSVASYACHLPCHPHLGQCHHLWSCPCCKLTTHMLPFRSFTQGIQLAAVTSCWLLNFTTQKTLRTGPQPSKEMAAWWHPATLCSPTTSRGSWAATYLFTIGKSVGRSFFHTLLHPCCRQLLTFYRESLIASILAELVCCDASLNLDRIIQSLRANNPGLRGIFHHSLDHQIPDHALDSPLQSTAPFLVQLGLSQLSPKEWTYWHTLGLACSVGKKDTDVCSVHWVGKRAQGRCTNMTISVQFISIPIKVSIVNQSLLISPLLDTGPAVS